MGSSVPAWPALAALKAQRILPTAWAEVMPRGLSKTNQPCTGLPRRLRPIIPVLVPRRQIWGDIVAPQQLLDMVGVVKAVIDAEF